LLYIIYVFTIVCILYTCFGGSPAREADKIRTDEHKANVALEWSRDYVAYVHRPGGTDERKGLRFVGFAWPTNVS
jgi:hypothetical protein